MKLTEKPSKWSSDKSSIQCVMQMQLMIIKDGIRRNQQSQNGIHQNQQNGLPKSHIISQDMVIIIGKRLQNQAKNIIIGKELRVLLNTNNGIHQSHQNMVNGKRRMIIKKR